jgi:phospholipid/cholesterol/gamma-HCH transport system ATP-binding protein
MVLPRLTYPSENAVVEITNLRKGFGNQHVLSDVSLQLYNGENLVVIGRSGAGKSVLIKCIVRLLDPDGGSVNVLGENVMELNDYELGEMRKKIGFLFQSGALYDSMTVRQNLEFPLKRVRKELNNKQIDSKIHDALESVGLVEAINKMPAELSGGMRKRISLARTIIVDPMIMLYDEPTTGLDPETAYEISSLINYVKNKYKTSSIIITHDIDCARTVANRIIMLRNGEVYKEGDFQDFDTSDDESVKSFFMKRN